MSPEQLRAATIEASSRVLAFVEEVMREHPCCFDPATAPQVTANLMSPITDVLPASNPTDQKEG